MKTNGDGPTKQPRPAPADWQKASLDSVPRLLRDYGPWLEAQGEHRNLSTLLNTYCKSAQGKRAAIILLTAQVRYWKEKAVEALEILQDHSIQTRMPRRVWSALLRHASDWAAKQPPEWGDQTTTGYNWLAVQHRGSDLRKALGYGETQFLKLTRKFQRLTIQAPSRGKIFSTDLALDLLAYRLSTTGSDRRAKIAEEIWNSARNLTHKKLPKLRGVLLKSGAKCVRMPEIDPIYKVLGGC